MKEDLYTWDTRSLDEKRRFPSENFFEPNQITRDRDKREARETLDGAELVVLGDADADGLGAKAGIDEYHGETLPFVPCGPHGGGVYLGEALQLAAEVVADGATVYVQDVCVDAEWKIKALPSLVERADVIWFDHHEWEPEPREFAEEHATYFEVDEGEDDDDAGVFNARCTAMMVRDYFEAQGHEFSESFHELVEVTGEYDLWRLRDDRCFDLNDFANAVENLAFYTEMVREYGADVMEDSRVQTIVENHRDEKDALHDLALEHVERYQIGEWVVATVYGNCPTNEVAETLREAGMADLVIVSKPHGGLSFRGSEQFTKCHILAREFGGGGHAQAAGAFPDAFDFIGDYAEHWMTEGESVIGSVIREVQQLAEEDSATATDGENAPTRAD